MKRLHTSYTFTPGAANTGTVQLTGVTITLDQLLLITNVTRGIIIYNFADTSLNATRNASGGNTTFTLEADTSTQSNTDNLQIFYDDAASVLPSNITQVGGSTVSSTNPLFVRPSISVIKVSCNTLTRPANTTAYVANSSISNSTTSPSSRTFSSVVSVNGGSGEIVRAILRSSDPITGSIRLYLRNDNSAPTATNDGSTYSSPITDLQTNAVGYIDFSATVPGRYSEGLLSSGSTMPFTCGGSTTSLFGQLMCVTGFTPVSGQTIDIDLWVVDRN